jgi:choline kinase
VIGLVLAAGASRRLRPETDALPKALLAVAGQTTILDMALRNLAAVGLSEAVIVIGYAAEAVTARVPALERASGLTIELVHNDRALDWNNAYSLWLARHFFGGGALLVNGDTVHPKSVEQALLAASAHAAQGPAPPAAGRLILAIDSVKPLAEEEMKVVFDDDGRLLRITKAMDPAQAHGEYIGATLIEPSSAKRLSQALEATWRTDPGLYYEDGFAEFAARGGEVLAAPIGAVDWVEVDDHADLRRAREIAGRC